MLRVKYTDRFKFCDLSTILIKFINLRKRKTDYKPEQIYSIINSRAKKIVELMTAKGKKNLDENLKLLDDIIVKLENDSSEREVVEENFENTIISCDQKEAFEEDFEDPTIICNQKETFEEDFENASISHKQKEVIQGNCYSDLAFNQTSEEDFMERFKAFSENSEFDDIAELPLLCNSFSI